MRPLVDFLTYEVELGHWWLIIIGLFHVKTWFVICSSEFRGCVYVLPRFKDFGYRFVSQLTLQMGLEIVQPALMQFELLCVINVDG